MITMWSPMELAFKPARKEVLVSKTLSHGPSGTAIGGLATVTCAPVPINYEADMLVIEEGVGKVVYTDVTSPADRPSTLRIAQTSKPNIYTGTSIDPSVFLASKRGTDTYIEAREVWSVIDTEDSTFLQEFPVRCSLALALPDTAYVSDEDIEALVGRVIAALYAQGEATPDTGINALLHGVVKKY